MLRFAALLTVLLVVAHKSQAQSYVAEGYFVVDDKAVQRYVNEIPGTASASVKRTQALASINADIEYFLTEINKLFQTLQPSGLNVQIKKRSLEILSTNVLTSGFIADGVLPATEATSIFKTWLEGQNSYATLNFDFAILWTGYDLYGALGTNSVGSSYAGSICQNTSAIGVVEFDAYYATVIHTAKYIAYILGASEDGVAIKNVMSILLTPDDEDRWEFSSCAASDIQAEINTLSPNCLLQTNSASITPSTSWSSYTGQLFNPDVICQRRINDSRSYMCKFASVYNNQVPAGNVICQAITCWLPETVLCVTTYTSEGLVCNRNGRCDDGVCAADSSSQSSNVDARCVHGDQKKLFIPSLNFDGTCAEFISQYGKDECYSESISSACCATCKTKCTGPAGCECGDKSTACTNYPRSAVCPAYKDTLCCEYCQGFVGKRSLFGAQYNASLVLEVKDHAEVEVIYETVHESIVREVE